jgi:DNA-binding CsgD family transcriptional regulator
LLCLVFAGCGQRADEEAQLCYEQGKALREQGEPAQAMQVFLRAAQCGHDERLSGRVYSNMANMCRQAGEHGKAYRVYAVSAEHFAAADDTLAYAYALNNMAWEQAVMGHKDSALALVDSAVHCYPRSPLTEKVTETRAAACFFREDYDSVLYYTAPPANDYLLMLRAQAYSYLQQDDSATYYAQLLLPRTTDPFYLDDLYYILAHNDTSASKEDVLLVTSERVDVQQIIEARHGKLTQAVLLMEMDERGSHGPWIMTAYLLAVLISIGLSVWAIIIHRRHTHLHHELTQQEALRQHERERNIRLLVEVPDIRKELPWDDYPALCRQIDKRFHGLADRLQAEGLNEQDVRLSLLVLLGMSHREMADILNCSPKSIGKLKDVTAHKLGISGGQLQQKLHSFA